MKTARASVFKLTPTEVRVLVMMRQGMKRKEIATALGWKSSSKNGRIGSMCVEAAEKERLMNIVDKPTHGRSSLSRARGEIRMQGTK